MAEPIPGAAHPEEVGLGRIIEQLTKILALFGGLILVGVALMSVVSVIGRALFGSPLTGDFELVQMGSAIAVAAFLPYCQLRRGHVIVDFFTHSAGPGLRRVLDCIGALLMCLCIALIAWRTFSGTVAMKENGETSMLLGLPIWYAYAALVPSLILLAITALYTAFNQPREKK
jgi:TRAP-type C4-dicarboxylate transport system permease small subunit